MFQSRKIEDEPDCLPLTIFTAFVEREDEKYLRISSLLLGVVLEAETRFIVEEDVVCQHSSWISLLSVFVSVFAVENGQSIILCVPSQVRMMMLAQIIVPKSVGRRFVLWQFATVTGDAS